MRWFAGQRALGAARRGMLMLQIITSLFVLALVLGTLTPLYLSSQRVAEREMSKARMQVLAREISAAFSSDVRQASAVQVGDGGRSVRLTLSAVDRSSESATAWYRYGQEGLVREVRRPNGGGQTERMVYGAPLQEARFAAAGAVVEARLWFAQPARGRELRYDLTCRATRRSTP